MRRIFRQHRSNIFLATLALFLVMFSIVAVKKAYASNTNCNNTPLFICPNSVKLDSDFTRWDRINTPNANSVTQVSPGQVIDLSMDYQVSTGTPLQVFEWFNIDIANGQFGGFTNPNGGTDLKTTPNHPYGCPSVWFGVNSNYFNSTWEGDRSNPVHNGDPFDPIMAGSGSDLRGYTTCGFQGQAISWTSNGASSGQRSRQASFQVNPNTKDTNQFCVRAYVSLGREADVFARSDVKCYYVVIPPPSGQVTVSGNIRSNSNYATGKGFAYFGDARTTTGGQLLRAWGAQCDDPFWAFNFASNPGHGVEVGRNGDYNFFQNRNEKVCLSIPPSPTFEGTAYDLEGLPGSNLFNGFTSSDIRKDFIYDPRPQTPTISKSVNPSGSLGLGNQVDFYITITNDQDANQPGFHFYDAIPLNIDPRTVTADISMSTLGSAPSSWQICSVAPSSWATVWYGNSCGGPNLVTDFIVGVNGGSGANPWSVTVNAQASPATVGDAVGRMPAYSQMVVHIKGNVWTDQAHIGVYPGYATAAMDAPADVRYCADTTGVDFSQINDTRAGNSPLQRCQDFTSGNQGVINGATIGIDWMSPRHVSNFTYNPIPGNVCVAKRIIAGAVYISNSGSGDDFISQCGIPTHDANGANGYYDYSAATTATDINYGKFASDVVTSGGPVQYSLFDQGNNPGDPSNGDPLDPAIATPLSSGPDNGGSVSGSRVVSWPIVDSRSTPSQTFTFGANFTNAGGLGSVHSNVSKACYIQYWIGGHPMACSQSNKILMKSVNKVTPYITGEGDVRAGQGLSGACSPTDIGTGGIASGANPHYGAYAVIASGDSGGAKSLSGYAQSNAVAGCMPDLVTAATNLEGRPGQSVGFAGFGGQAAYQGKLATVTPVGGVLDINGAQQISGRWTLFVRGKVYIHNNITYNFSTPGAINATPSFGIIATDGIYIDKGVSNLQGYYYTAGRINTCAASDSVTLASGYSAADCGISQLQVNGLMMAKTFRFNRTWHKDESPQVTTYPYAAEYAKMIGQLFTATPPGFNEVARSYNAPNYGPEKSPRY